MKINIFETTTWLYSGYSGNFSTYRSSKSLMMRWYLLWVASAAPQIVRQFFGLKLTPPTRPPPKKKKLTCKPHNFGTLRKKRNINYKMILIFQNSSSFQGSIFVPSFWEEEYHRFLRQKWNSSLHVLRLQVKAAASEEARTFPSGHAPAVR